MNLADSCNSMPGMDMSTDCNTTGMMSMGSGSWLSIGFVASLLIAVFYAVRWTFFRRTIKNYDGFSESMHGVMGLGMAYMFAPSSLQIFDYRVGVGVFAAMAVWFIYRIAWHRRHMAHFNLWYDITHVAMCASMIYMFAYLRIGNRLGAESFIAAFGIFVLYYAWEVYRDFKATSFTPGQRNQAVGTDVAHAGMGILMIGMFVAMV